MNKPSGMRGSPKVDELLRLPGAASAAPAAKAKTAALRKRPDEELIAPEAAFTAGENPPDQSVATDEIPPQPLEAASEEEVVAEDGGSAEDAYSSVEADAWSAEWTTATDSEDRILLAQAGPGGGGGEGGGAGGLNDLGLGIVAGAGALLLLGGGGGGGSGGVPAASFAEISGDLGATVPEEVIAPVTGTAHRFFIGAAAGLSAEEGFSRDLLPATLAALDAQMVYDFRFSYVTSDTGTIDHTGLQVNMTDGDPIDVYVSVSASATGTESHLIWLGNVGVDEVALSSSADATANVKANAFAGGDAEVGITNFNVSLAGTSEVTASASLDANARGADSMAGAFIGGDMRVSATAASATARVDQVHAYAQGTDAVANAAIGGDLSVSAIGQTYATAVIGSIGASASYLSTAEVSIGGDVTVSAAGTYASASVGSISASAEFNSYAHVDIGGDVYVSASGQTYATAAIGPIGASASYSSTAEMSIAGKVGVNAYADGISAGASASVDIIDADATYTSVARVEIGGSVSVSATAINGAAKAYVDQISASASYNATASVSIDGDLDLRALGEDRAWAGIGEFSDAGSVDGISASAYDGGAADVSIFGDVDVNATATSSGTATAMVGRIGAYAEGTSAHASVSITGDVTVGAVGEDHAVAFVGYVSAYASDGGYASNAIADVTIAGGLHVHATATNANGDAYAYVSGIAAFASNDAQAHVTIGPAVVPADFDAVTVHAEGRDNALAYVPIHAYATSGNASAEIVINGNVRVSASAVTNDAIAMLFVGAGVTSNGSFTESGDGRVEINGDISVRANGQADVSAFAQIIARDSGSVDVTGSVNISVDGGLNPEAKLDIFAGVDNAVDIGNLNVYVGGSSGTADVFVQRPVTWTEVDDFLTHGSSSADIGLGDLTAFVNMYGHANFYMGGGTQSSSNPDDISWDINRMASLSGDGGVYMQLFDQIFGTIDASGLTGGADHLNLEYDLGDHDFATVGTGTEDAHVTTIVGFSGSGTNIMFNTTNPAGGNFTALATESGTADAFIGVLNAALDTKNYVFAVYGGTDDINGDGNVGGDGGNGFLAYDQDGNGITAVLMLPGVTTLAHTDIHNLITPP